MATSGLLRCRFMIRTYYEDKSPGVTRQGPSQPHRCCKALGEYLGRCYVWAVHRRIEDLQNAPLITTTEFIPLEAQELSPALP